MGRYGCSAAGSASGAATKVVAASIRQRFCPRNFSDVASEAAAKIEELRAERDSANLAYLEVYEKCTQLRAELAAAQEDAAELHDIVGAQRELIERLRNANDPTGLTLYEEAADEIAGLRQELAIVREELAEERRNNSRFGVGA